MNAPNQSILPLDLAFKPMLADVRMGHNGLALHAAKAWLNGLQAVSADLAERFVLCWGASGVGKTMLCQALYHGADPQQGLVAWTTAYLSPHSTVADFECAIEARAIIIDDIHALNPLQANAAFNLYNHVRSTAHKQWWASSRVPPSHMSEILPDLASRTAWGLVFEQLPLPDDDGAAVLQAQAQRLGFDLSAETAHYLLLRLERNLGVLAQHMDSLNRYALALKKPVNNYLVQQWYAQVYLAKPV